MYLACRWVGIDCGYSQMGIAVLDEADHILAAARTHQPQGDGHSKEVALARLRILLNRIHAFRDSPVRLAGYCYEHMGVYETFRDAGWHVIGSKALNDVIGIYGLTDMPGNVVIGGCGSWPQVVYVDEANVVHWPGDDVTTEMSDWLLSGWCYAKFLVKLSQRKDLPQVDWLRQAVRERLGEADLIKSNDRWGTLGTLLPQMLECPEVRQFLAAAASAVVETRNILWKYSLHHSAPAVAIGGGAVSDERIWAVLGSELQSRGMTVNRVVGNHAVGLARFAKHNPDVNAWAFIGRERPSWLS